MLILLLAASACSDALGPERSELERARARWEAAALDEYRYTYQLVCFCLPLRGVVEVRDGAVVAVLDPATGDPLPEAERERFPTVDELFATLAEWIASDPARMDVTYDRELGYPTDAFFDFELDVADEEQGFLASELVPLSDLQFEVDLPAVIVR